MSQSTLTKRSTTGATLFDYAQTLGLDPTYTQWRELERLVGEVAVRAFQFGEQSALLDVQRFLYEVYSHRILPPWSKYYRDYDHPAIQAAHKQLSDAWLAEQRATHHSLASTPASVEDFPGWAKHICESHPSGVTHPLFDYLEKQATAEQLSYFNDQETPFDIHFGDLVAMLLPGVHDAPKIELAGNFWDEMGRGTAAVTHRRLRLDFMRRVGVSEDAYLTDVSRYWVEELCLANMYFQTSTERRLAPQAMGMLLATEMVVPGRLDRQINGWRRLGLPDADMHYLLEHVTVDVEHAEGWLDNVVMPLLRACPHLLPEFALGVVRRLDAALAVCDRAMDELDRVA